METNQDVKEMQKGRNDKGTASDSEEEEESLALLAEVSLFSLILVL